MTLALDDDATDTATIVDRRRPGRLAEVSPQLLPLLRAEERAKLTTLDEALEISDRQLDTGPGIALGLGLGALLWTALIVGGWSLASVI